MTLILQIRKLKHRDVKFAQAHSQCLELEFGSLYSTTGVYIYTRLFCHYVVAHHVGGRSWWVSDGWGESGELVGRVRRACWVSDWSWGVGGDREGYCLPSCLARRLNPPLMHKCLFVQLLSKRTDWRTWGDPGFATHYLLSDCLVSLGFSFLICKVEVTILLSWYDSCEDWIR